MKEEVIVPLIIGIILIVIGIGNLKGYINTLHKYHRKRVSEEDRMAFGKIEGIGTIICGSGLLLSSFLKYLGIASYISDGVVIVGLIIGLGISFYGMFKYNKGIF